jgi:5'-methylthioadenosine phosphorylase
MKNQAEIGIIGGSGFYEFLACPAKPGGRSRGKWIDVKTPYGKPSDKIFLGEYKGKKIAFLPRHARGHKIPPHKINYRANIWAMKELGVKIIIAPSAVGSLRAKIKRGDFVIPNEFIDRTNNREDTFFHGPKVVHVSSADCYCDKLRKIAFNICKKNKLRVHDNATVVVIQGPRFSTHAESKWFTKMGWDIINMTQYPEVVLAREAEICYLNISLVTDYDAGLIGKVNPVSIEEVIRVFSKNTEKLKKVILEIIAKIPKDYKCEQCHEALKNAAI